MKLQVLHLFLASTEKQTKKEGRKLIFSLKLEPNQNKLARCYEWFNFLLKVIIDTPVSLGLIWELDR